VPGNLLFTATATQLMKGLSGQMPQFPANSQRSYVNLSVTFSSPWDGGFTNGGAPSESTGGQAHR
jgi:hypothetical protein